MADGINNYSFDFETEAEALRQSLPWWKRKKILLAEVNVSEDKSGTVDVDLLHLAGDDRPKKKLLPDIRREIDKQFKAEPYFGSYEKSVAYAQMYNFVFFRTNSPFNACLGEDNTSLMQLFTLYHETGHALITGGPRIDKTHPYGECAADAYAALRFLRRFGDDAKPIISMISWKRTYNAVNFLDTTHLTTTVLDKIIADSATRDFSKLSEAQTIKLAAEYAKKWMPEDAAFEASRMIFTQGDQINFPLLASTCLGSSDNFAFYIGAKFFQPFLQPEGIVRDDETIQIPDDERQKYAAMIEQRASGISLRDIVNPAAKKPEAGPQQPLIETLKVSRPRGQKQFIYKP